MVMHHERDEIIVIADQFAISMIGKQGMPLWLLPKVGKNRFFDFREINPNTLLWEGVYMTIGSC